MLRNTSSVSHHTRRKEGHGINKRDNKIIQKKLVPRFSRILFSANISRTFSEDERGILGSNNFQTLQFTRSGALDENLNLEEGKIISEHKSYETFKPFQ